MEVVAPRTVPRDAANSLPVKPQKGFIAFCETNLRYEKGFKAWIILGPYLLGAFVLERIALTPGTPSIKLVCWTVFLVYLAFFPESWRRLLRWRNSRKNLASPSRES